MTHVTVVFHQDPCHFVFVCVLLLCCVLGWFLFVRCFSLCFANAVGCFDLHPRVLDDRQYFIARSAMRKKKNPTIMSNAAMRRESVTSRRVSHHDVSISNIRKKLLLEAVDAVFSLPPICTHVALVFIPSIIRQPLDQHPDIDKEMCPQVYPGKLRWFVGVQLPIKLGPINTQGVPQMFQLHQPSLTLESEHANGSVLLHPCSTSLVVLFRMPGCASYSTLDDLF